MGNIHNGAGKIQYPLYGLLIYFYNEMPAFEIGA